MNECQYDRFKLICRTLLYQFVLLFVGASVGFILNAEYVGWKYPVISNSFSNIFYPVKFDDPGVREALYASGQWRIWALNGYPKGFKVIEQALSAEEWYWCKYSYTDRYGNDKINIDHTRIRWKPWEYYFSETDIDPITQEEIEDYVTNGSLTSNDTDRAFVLAREWKEMQGIKLR